jgi:hypothetical protein
MALPADFDVASFIDEAFERIGFDPSAIVDRHIESAQRSIRLMLDSWNNDGVNFWKVVTEQRLFTAGDQTFAPVSGIMDIMRASVLRGTIYTPMVIISAGDWFAIPDKTSAAGLANRLWFQKSIPPFINVWPKAENSTDILVYDAILEFDDSGTLASAPNIRQQWNGAFAAGLAFHLAEKFAPARLAEKAALYGGPGKPGGAYGVAKMGERERSDTVMVVNKTRRWRR